METKRLKRFPLGNRRFNWKQREFTLSTFSYLSREDEEGERLCEIVERATKNSKDAGFNLLELGWVPHNKAWAAAEACEKYGIDLIFQDLSMLGGMQHNIYAKNVTESTVRGVVDALRDKKHVIGYYVWDEPVTDRHRIEARRQMDIFEKLAPDALLFTVNVPSCNGGGDPNDPSELPKYWENGLYEKNFRRFVEILDPPVISFDYYPIGDYFHVWGDHCFSYENQLDDTFLWCDLALARKLAKEKDVPLWFYYQGCRLFECTKHFTFPMVRCMMYGAALYGAKGLQHYQAFESVIDSEGNKGEFFDEQKAIHAEFRNLGNTLMALESEKIYHSADLLPGCEYLTLDDISESDIFASELPARSSVGEFSDGYGNRYLMILNRDFEKPLTADLPLKADFRIYEVDKTSGEQRLIGDRMQKIELSLDPGDAVLIRIQPSEDEPFLVSYVLEED